MSKALKIDNVYFFDRETKEKKSRYDKVSRDLRYIPRANNPDKSLSKGARSLAANYYDMISKSDNGIIFVSHDFISSISEVGHSQNKRYHNELRDLFNIQYHQSIMIGDRKYRDGFKIEFTENTEIILKNPKLFYTTYPSKKEQLPVQKRTPRRPKKNASLYIDREKPLDKPLEYSYIANRMNLEKNDLKMSATPEQKVVEANIANKKFRLDDFYPLTLEDASNLRILSGRSFELVPMNEILLKIHNYTLAKDAHLQFEDKNHFLHYFAKRLASEKRDAYKINTVSFRINANIKPEEKESLERNRYLEQIENSGDLFKRSIAARLSEKKAYSFLKSYSGVHIANNIAKIYLDNSVELNKNDLEVILKEIQLTHDKNGNVTDAISKMLNPETIDEVNKIELVIKNTLNHKNNMPTINQQILDSFGKVRGQEILTICSITERPEKGIKVQIKEGCIIPDDDKNLLRQCIKEVYGDVEIHTNKSNNPQIIRLDQRHNSPWFKFKKGILEQLRPSEGEHIFKAWFDNLECQQDAKNNQLTLSGKEFWINHISQNYSQLIERTAKNQKITVTLIYENKNLEPGYRPIIFTPLEGRKF